MPHRKGKFRANPCVPRARCNVPQGNAPTRCNAPQDQNALTRCNESLHQNGVVVLVEVVEVVEVAVAALVAVVVVAGEFLSKRNSSNASLPLAKNKCGRPC